MMLTLHIFLFINKNTKQEQNNLSLDMYIVLDVLHYFDHPFPYLSRAGQARQLLMTSRNWFLFSPNGIFSFILTRMQFSRFIYFLLKIYGDSLRLATFTS